MELCKLQIKKCFLKTGSKKLTVHEMILLQVYILDKYTAIYSRLGHLHKLQYPWNDETNGKFAKIHINITVYFRCVSPDVLCPSLWTPSPWAHSYRSSQPGTAAGPLPASYPSSELEA
jgi:hypothetical protein